MTLPTLIKKQLKKRFHKAWSKKAPDVVHVIAKDFMQHMKGTLPDNIVTVNDLKAYFIKLVRQELSRRNQCSVLIICFDTSTVEVKSIVEYGTRKEWRCKHCKKLKEDTFSDKCERNCKNSKPLKFEDGPHFPLDHDMRLPVSGKQWMRFASDSRNLRRELYPILMNCFLEGGNFIPNPGQTIITCGLPCMSKIVPVYDPNWDKGFNATADTTLEVLIPWRLDNLPVSDAYFDAHPDMYSQVYRIQNFNGMVHRHKVPEMCNNIAEADNSVFFFMQFFPNANYMVDINDGDAISIGLLRVLEDFVAGKCIRERYIALPNKTKPKPGELKYSHDYLNLVELKHLIEQDPQYLQANVANPVATLVFLIIISSTDFFKNYCPGIGIKTIYSDDEKKRAKQKQGIWDTFHAMLPTFSHMIQWNINDMIPDPTVKRRIVIDEELFKLFTQYCYVHKYGKKDFATVRTHCSKFKDKRKHMPTDQQMMLWVRQIDWNIQYWLNACRDIEIDPFKVIDDVPYYGYDKKTMTITKRVAATQEPVDEVYKRHFHKRRKKQKTKGPKKIATKRVYSAMDAVRGKL